MNKTNNKNNKYYFAYGSNMDIAQMSQRCPFAVFAGAGKIHGYKFIINSCGAATIIPQKSGEVYGVLWNITKINERVLDKYEGVKWGKYEKLTIDVELTKGKSVPALTYVARDNTFGAPSPGYMERIVIAAVQHGLPDKYIAELVSWRDK